MPSRLDPVKGLNCCGLCIESLTLGQIVTLLQRVVCRTMDERTCSAAPGALADPKAISVQYGQPCSTLQYRRELSFTLRSTRDIITDRWGYPPFVAPLDRPRCTYREFAAEAADSEQEGTAHAGIRVHISQESPHADRSCAAMRRTQVLAGSHPCPPLPTAKYGIPAAAAACQAGPLAKQRDHDEDY